jgi:CRISPR-associated protein Csb2
MLALGIRYLCGWSMAKCPANQDRAEWPPHPDRVFMALAAAYFETEGSAAERAALEWLEQLGSPELIASDCFSRSVVTAFVPVNDARLPQTKAGKEPSPQQVADGMNLLPERRSRQPRTFPVAIPEDEAVFLIWREAEPDEAVLQALVELCRKVTYVGHSASLVQMWVEKELAALSNRPTWVPTTGVAANRLRITSAGRLASLETHYNKAAVYEYARLTTELETAKSKRKTELKKELVERFGSFPPVSQRPAFSLSIGYRKSDPQAVAKELGTVFDPNPIILRRIGGCSLGLESTLAMSEAIRGTIMITCPDQPPPEWISGHTADGSASSSPHLAFFPLPHVGREHADGHLLGIGVAIPSVVDPAEQARCLGPLLYDDRSGELRETELRMGAVGVWQVCMENRDRPPVALQSNVWTQPSLRWATVTPIVLDRHSKSNNGATVWKEAEETIAKACERIGLAWPRDIILSSVSMFIGAPHARRFPCLQRKTGGNRHHAHAIITFDNEVRGPVLLGAGRYRGYGLCRPWSKENGEGSV